jgi:Flp pilus assembly pilin Flp
MRTLFARFVKDESGATVYTIGGTLEGVFSDIDSKLQGGG